MLASVLASWTAVGFEMEEAWTVERFLREAGTEPAAMKMREERAYDQSVAAECVRQAQTVQTFEFSEFVLMVSAGTVEDLAMLRETELLRSYRDWRKLSLSIVSVHLSGGVPFGEPTTVAHSPLTFDAYYRWRWRSLET